MTYPTLKRGGRAALIRSYSDEKYEKTNAELYLFFSPTINDDVLLLTEEEFVLWMILIEMDPRIKAVDYRPDPPDQEHATEVATFLITLSDGLPSEIHYISDSLSVSDVPLSFSRRNTPVIHHSDDIKKDVPIALRYHQLTCYAAAIRDCSCEPEENSVRELVAKLQRGSINDLAQALPYIEYSILVGVISRLVARGVVRVDLSNRPICFSTMWAARC